MVICPECQSHEKHSRDFCGACGYPFAIARRGPSKTLEEQVLFEGRASVRALIPVVVRFAVSVGLLVFFFHYVLAQVPGWLAELDSSWSSASVTSAFEKMQEVAFWVELALLLVLFFKFMARAARVRRTRVKVTNERIVLESGLLSRYVDDIDMSRVVDVTSRQGIVERLLQIGRVEVRSSDPARPRLELGGMGEPQDLRELIRARMART